MKTIHFALSCSIAIMGMSMPLQAAVIAQYTFSDGNATTATNSGTLGPAMNGAVIGGSITTSAFSPDNQALLLGGAAGNGVSLPNGYDFGSAFTVESLVRLDTLQGTSNIIFDDFGAPGVVLQVITATERLSLGSSTVDNGTFTIGSSVAFTTSKWHHVAAVYDGALMQLFYDGAMVASQPASGLVDNHPAVTPNIGVESDDSLFPWEGAIDDFRIHDVALSVSQFNGGNPIPLVPEPSRALFVLVGIAAMGLRRRRG